MAVGLGGTEICQYWQFSIAGLLLQTAQQAFHFPVSNIQIPYCHDSFPQVLRTWLPSSEEFLSYILLNCCPLLFSHENSYPVFL